MKRFKRAAALFMATAVLMGCGAVPEMPDESVSENAVTELPPASPVDDFYRYVNEETLANAEFEYGAMSAGGGFDSTLVEDQVKGIIKDVVAGESYGKGTEEYIIKTAYDNYIAYDFDNAPVPEELDALMHEVDDISSLEEFFEIDAMLSREYGISNILNLSVDMDYLDSSRYILVFGQYKAIMDADFETLDDSYDALNSVKEVGSAMRRAMGHNKDESDEYGNSFGYIVMDIYNDTDMAIAEEIMNFKYFKEYTLSDAEDIFTNVDLESYIENLGYDIDYCDIVGVYDEGQLVGLNDVFTEDNLEGLKTWKLSQIGATYRRFIAAGYDDLGDYLQIDYKTAEDSAIDEMYNVFYDQTDILYLENYYTAQMDVALISLCDDIKGGYRELIGGADWLTEETREGLLEKLDNIVYVTGMNVVRHDVSDYASLSGDDYFEYFVSYKKILADMEIEDLTKTPDRFSVGMPMQMLNACYNPSYNNITITVAIMNEPFFSMDADYYTNLGGLGMVIAHEMGHAFDSNCILFDENGNYNPSWIADEDMETLLERNEKAVEYFENNFTVFGVYHVDGEQTLGENYADLGGMECVSSLTTTKEQRILLFENYARIWCEKRVDSSLLDQLDIDEHSPSVIRTNAILSTLDLFYETYDVKEGDGMYIPPEDRISRWY